MKKMSKGDRAFEIVVYVIIAILCVIFIYPLLYIVFLSFSSPEAVYYGQVTFFIKDFSLEAYKAIGDKPEIFTGLWNTVKMVVIGTVLSLALTFSLAYPLSRKDLKGRKIITTLCVFTMFFSGGLVPLFIVVQALGLYNTLWATILPCSVSVWNVIVVRTFMSSTIPSDLQEAAQIDGASDFRIYLQIIIPLCKPIIAIMILFYGVGYWNSYFYPLVFISPSKTDMKTLQLVMREILLNDGSGSVGEDALKYKMLSEAVKYSSIVVTTLPILIAYPFLAKHLEKGMMIGSVKG